MECPITLAPLHDPVRTPSGQVYERAAILVWLESHSTDPFTRAPLFSRDLKYARDVAQTINKAAVAQSFAVDLNRSDRSSSSSNGSSSSTNGTNGISIGTNGISIGISSRNGISSSNGNGNGNGNGNCVSSSGISSNGISISSSGSSSADCIDLTDTSVDCIDLT